MVRLLLILDSLISVLDSSGSGSMTVVRTSTVTWKAAAILPGLHCVIERGYASALFANVGSRFGVS